MQRLAAQTVAALVFLVWMAPLAAHAAAQGAEINPFAPPSAQSILIVGGTVIDGSGRRRRQRDVRVSGDHIVAVGRLRPRRDERIIQARGLVVSPGFIDMHSHVDGQLFKIPTAESSIRQGITTAIVGQDGGSHFPLAKYFHQLAEAHVALNIGSYVGHGTVRGKIMGDGYKRAATPREIARMRQLVEQEMKSGALGLSSGLEYDPGFYSTTGELISLAQVAGRYHGIYISHVRDEGDKALDSFRELIRIAREGHLPAEISHIKLDTRPVWGKAGQAIRLMQQANRQGLSITADVYPYLYWQSTIIVIIPTRNWDDRAAWQKGLAEVGGPQHILMSEYTPNPAWKGKTIAQIAASTHRDPISVIQDIIHHTHGKGARGGERVVVTAMSEADLRRFIASPLIMFCTDEGLRPTHPRGAGSFPRILGRYVREQHLLTLEEAVHKASAQAAQRLGFQDRGLVRPGYKADLVLFNPRTVLDTATTSTPAAHPIGIPYVLVNGQIVLDDGRITGACPGRVLRHDSNLR